MTDSVLPMRPQANSAAIVGGSDQKYRFTILTAGLLRFEYASDGAFEDRASTFAVNRNLLVPSFHKVDSDNCIEIVTDYFHLFYNKQEFSSAGLRVQVKGNVTNWHSQWRYGYHHEEELFQLGGTARTLDRANGRIPLGRGVISKNGYSVIDDSTSMVFREDGWVEARNQHPCRRVDGYLFAYGHDYRAAIKALYQISGSQPILPRWCLGIWWSRYHEYTDDEYLALVDQFHSRGTPLSVAVLDMDWHWVDSPKVHKAGSSGWTGYSWNTSLFPDPKEFLAKLHERGLYVALCDHPADGVASYEDSYKEMCEALERDSSSGHPVPFDCTNPRFLKYYFGILLQRLEDDGIDFWWVDWQSGPFSSVPGLDPLWVLNHFHFLNSAKHHRRPVTFSRYAGPGSHRYPVGFSGDTVISWEALDFQPEFTATSSNVGYGWWSHDIGGHMHGYRDDELATRWLQLGVFSPILRLHSTNNPWMSKEPWNYGAEAQKAQEMALNLRNRLVPYLYSMNVRSAKDDEPLVQPVYWHHPKREEAYIYKNTYFFGSELLVAPITTPRSPVTKLGSVTTWLPPGRWVDVITQTVYSGNRLLQFHRQLDDYPVLARGGSILPFSASPDSSAIPSSLEIYVVVGADGLFELFEDDNCGSTLRGVHLVKTRITFTQAIGRLLIEAASDFIPTLQGDKRSWKVSFLCLAASNREVQVRNAETAENREYEIMPRSTGLQVQVSPVSTSETLEIIIGENPTLALNSTRSTLHSLLGQAQMSYDLKKQIWAIVTNEKYTKNHLTYGPAASRSFTSLPVDGQIQQLFTLNGLDEALRNALIEVMTADSGIRQ